MTDYLLFLDTEASSLPKNWNLPYSEEGNWPFSVQIAWIIYTRAGLKVKEENHYIKDENVDIATSAIKVHGITHDFLRTHGEDRKKVMQMLADDLHYYKPLVVGHFMEFDAHMVGADFYRTGLDNPVKLENSFCTMVGTQHLVRNPSTKFFKLGELYKFLFHGKCGNQHNALDDAKTTAEVFFELVKRGEIDDMKIEQQQKAILHKTAKKDSGGCSLVLLVLISLFFLIYYI